MLILQFYGKEKDISRTLVEAASDKAASGTHRAIASERRSLEMVSCNRDAYNDSAVCAVQERQEFSHPLQMGQV
jgi:hypothetical protein